MVYFEVGGRIGFNDQALNTTFANKTCVGSFASIKAVPPVVPPADPGPPSYLPRLPLVVLSWRERPTRHVERTSNLNPSAQVPSNSRHAGVSIDAERGCNIGGRFPHGPFR